MSERPSMEQNFSLRRDVLLLHPLDGKSLSFEERNWKSEQVWTEIEACGWRSCMVAIKLNNWTQVGDARKTPMQTTTMATTTSITASTLTTAVVAKKWKSNNCKNSYINSHNSGWNIIDNCHDIIFLNQSYYKNNDQNHNNSIIWAKTAATIVENLT